MKAILSRLQIRKLLYLLLLSVLVTLLIAPNLNLVPTRYEEGDIITQDIVINDNVFLEDVRSTDLRRQQAVSDVPPVFDYDQKLSRRAFEDLKLGFDEMRKDLAELRRNRTEKLAEVRENALEQISILSDDFRARAHLPIVRRERNQIINDIGVLSDLVNPNSAQTFQMEKLRFDLRAVKGLLNSSRQSIEQQGQRLAQAKRDGLNLQEELENLKLEEEQAQLKMKEKFDKQLRIATEASEFSILSAGQFNPDLERKIISLLIPVLGQKIVSSPESLSVGGEVIQIQVLDPPKLERFEDLKSIVDVQKVRSQVNKLGQELEYPAERAGQRETTIFIAQKLVQPNLTENKAETERLKQEVIKSLSPVYFNLKIGDVVARAAEVATAQQVEVIKALNAYNLKNPKYPQLIGTFIIVLLALALLYQVIVLRAGGGAVSLSELLLMSILILTTLLLAQLLLAVVPAATILSDLLPTRTYNYFIPAALTSMLAGILLGFEVAVFLGIGTSLFLAILLGNSLPIFIFSMMGSLVGAIPMRHYDTRFALWQQGLRISAINLPVLLVLTLMDQNLLSWDLAYDLGAGIVNGLIVAFLASTILPLLERLFDITTNLRLLELSNMNHPALKELAVRAPGTYHHSIVVGNLSESAASGIRANSLLVRVASYYHDLGKMLCPLYFVENQQQKNYHDDLPAKTSTRIIINHVKDGLELAKRHKLGKAITDILAQHHGTSLVRYFYRKAEEEHAELDEPLQEMEYRYPGPKPQSKEAALVMVADVTEAATRSLDDPSPESIRKLVQKLATTIYMDGQLDESGLTFNDLNFVEKNFTKILLSIHHHRITYPELKIAARPDSHLDPSESDDEEPSDRDIVAGRRAST
ncbi:MAG: HDIG domain-containing protein [SAR324 cluster bacterium]|nr:HDIG domain-containing protein [SAR324 cluster bacterium]